MINKPLALTSGEPAGIGADIILSVLKDNTYPLCYVGDIALLQSRAKLLNKQDCLNRALNSGMLAVEQIDMLAPVHAGIINTQNSPYVIQTLERASKLALENKVHAIVTAPVHKAAINQAGIDFSGHTEFFAQAAGVKQVVMMLAGREICVALVTTHLPLKDVASHISEQKILATLNIVNQGLKKLGIEKPSLLMAGLNPHAGEEGILGREEIDIITPAILEAQQSGIDIRGPVSADTMFTIDNRHNVDVFVCLYHDQGLPVIKALEFGGIVNITLGLPFVRVSVDHGTALDLAGTGKACDKSLRTALNMTGRLL